MSSSRHFAAAALALAIGQADASLTLELRASGVTGGATVLDAKAVAIDAAAAPGSTVTFGLYAVVIGAPGDTVFDELFQLVQTSVFTYADGPKNIRGDLAPAQLPISFRASGFFAGALADLNGDGDLDVGGPAFAAIAPAFTYLKPRAATLLGAVPGISTDLYGETVGREWRFGTVTLTIGEIVDSHGDPILANFIMPAFTQTFYNLARATYCVDEIVQVGDPEGDAPNMHVGAPVTISVAAPEPSVFGMLGASALAVVGRRRAHGRRG